VGDSNKPVGTNTQDDIDTINIERGARVKTETQEPIRPNATSKWHRNILICLPRDIIHWGWTRMYARSHVHWAYPSVRSLHWGPACLRIEREGGHRTGRGIEKRRAKSFMLILFPNE